MKEILLAFVRAGLWGTNVPLSLCPTTEDEWNQLLHESCKQTVQGIVYDAVSCLSNVSFPSSFLQNWAELIRSLEARYHQHFMIINYLSARLGAVGLEPIVLKGLALAAYYPRPNHRVSGDIDLFFGSVENAEKANQTVEQWGTPVQRGGDDETVYMLNNTVVEHHGQLITSHNLFLKKSVKQQLAQQIADGSAFQYVKINNVPVKVLAPLQCHLLLMTHSLKHLLNEGIGLRQLCDVAMFLKTEHGNLEGDTLRKNLKDWGIYHWANLVYSFCVKHLGLSEQFLPYNFDLTSYNPDKLLAEVWLTGNFGQMDVRMSERSQGGDSVFTAKRMLHNSVKFMKYAPGDALGYPLKLTYLKIKDIIHLK